MGSQSIRWSSTTICKNEHVETNHTRMHKYNTDTHTFMYAQETDRYGSCFVDPSTRGMEEKVAKGWIEDILGRSTTVEEQDT